MTTTSDDADPIFSTNPYETHPELSTTQADLLWELAKLARNIKSTTRLTKELASEPEEAFISKLRPLEKKMGLVMTLFKASVWAVINERSDPSKDQESSYEEFSNAATRPG